MGLFKQRGGQASPVSDPDTLRSTAFAKLLFLLCKGPIRGFVGAELSNSFQIDGVPLKSPSGTLNYKGWETFWRSGTASQEYVPGIASNTQYQRINSIVRHSLPVSQTIYDSTLDAAEVTIRLPALLQYRDDGSIIGASIHYQIYLEAHNQLSSLVVDQIINGKTSSPYQRSHHIRLTGPAPWTIRVSKVTADSTDSDRLRNELYWDDLSRIDYEKRQYNGYVIAGLHIDAQQLSSVGRADIEIYGKIVSCPHNYNAIAHTYNGFFDGSLIPQWTDCPAWIAFDILKSKLPLISLDVYDFYEAARYCDERIDNKPRFTFNHVFEQRGEAYKVAAAVCGTFNGRLVPRGTSLGLAVDKPKTAIRQFTLGLSDMVGKPRYSRASYLDIPTVATVTYTEPEKNYEAESFEVIDQPGFDKYGYKPIDITALGCTNRNQAYRTALWTMASARLQPLSVEFTVPTVGRLIDLGDVFAIADPRRLGKRTSGRIIDFTQDVGGDRVTIDQDYFYAGNIEHNLMLVGSDGFHNAYPINTAASSGSLVVLQGRVNVTAIPSPGMPWVIRDDSYVAEWICIDRTEAELPNHYTITGRLYDASKYQYVDSLGALNAGNYNARSTASTIGIPAKPFAVSSIAIPRFSQSGAITTAITVSWDYPREAIPQLDYFVIEYRESGDVAWQSAGESRGRSLTLENLENIRYQFRVAGISRLGLSGEWGETSAEGIATGSLGDEPRAVSNLTLTKIEANTIHLKWDATRNNGVLRGGYHLIRHTPKIINAEWSDGTLVKEVQGYHNATTMPYQSGTFMIRTYDFNKRASRAIASAATGLSVRSTSELLYLFNESPLYLGQKINTAVANNKLRLAIGLDGFIGEGTYRFNTEYSTGSTTPQRLFMYPVVDVSVLKASTFWNAIPAPFSAAPASTFQAANEIVDYGEFPYAKMQASISQDGGTTYSDWTTVTPGEIFATNIRARVLFKSEDAQLSSEISDLQLLILREITA